MSHLPSIDDVVDSRPFKRMRFPHHEGDGIDLDSQSTTEDEHELGMRQLITEEIDLEIAIRQRLLSTIDSRLTWALMLHEALARDLSTTTPDVAPDDFQEAALDALNAAEVSSAFLFDREESMYIETEPPSRSFSPVTTIPRERIPPKVRPTRTTTIKPHLQKRLLYIRLPPAEIAVDEQVAVMTCPTCARTQFSTLQGLLNHARLAHGIEWASHDACIAACAVPIATNDEAEKERVEAEGVEVPWGGSVVGLQRLFERAVGFNAPLSLCPKDQQEASVAAATPSTLLSRTLGLHADSPALAPFLGKLPKRRCIHTYDEDTNVDILSIDSVARKPVPTLESREGLTLNAEDGIHPWRMAYPHRSRARPELDLVVDLPTLVDNGADITTTAVVPGSTTSRFHITARVCITDRSLYVPPNRRVELNIPPSHTHRWMLGLSAPSYSISLSSFMTRLTVLAAVASGNNQQQLCTVDKAPFAIIGSSSEPFLAKVVMEWTGGGRMEVEHWIDLDPGNAASSVLGSEQVLDVELDKGTRLLTVPPGPPPTLPSLERGPADISRQSAANSGAVNEFEYEKLLRSLLPRVPMTMKDMKFRMSIQVHYKLVPSPVHLLALVPGKRKAIEWGRARALQALYVQYAASASAELIALTVGDVYAFLEDSGLFPRPTVKTGVSFSGGKERKEKEQEPTPAPFDEPCFVCGIKKRLHPTLALTARVKKEPGPDEISAWVCDIVSPHEIQRALRIPIFDVTKIFGGLENALYAEAMPHDTEMPPHQPMGSQALKPLRYSCQHILLLSSPDLTLAIHKSVGSLRLSHFPELSSPLLQIHSRNSDVEEALAPSAVLAVVLKPLITILIRSAVEVARRDVAIASGGPGQSKMTRPKRGRKVGCILTPGHVLRGLSVPNSGSHAAASGGFITTTLKDVLGLCLARVGVPLEFGRSLRHACLRGTSGRDGNVETMETGLAVKMESP